MFSTLKKIFGFENGPDSYNEAELISYATLALMGTGQYAFQALTDDWPEWSKKMQNDLILFERKANEFKSPKLFILAGKGWENFSIWYRRKNEDKTTPLRQAIMMFNEALRLEPDNIEAKIGLAALLIERVQVLDLDKALNILNQISDKNDAIQLLITKAKRWTGTIEFEPNFDYTTIQLIPLTFLREERKKCRALLQILKKDENKEELIKVLEHMYRIAIIHDAATYVMLDCGYVVNPRLYNSSYRKLQTVTKNIHKYSYLKNGKIVESNNCFVTNQCAS
jgi:tetratricopeptide (TPR) repeat protein